MAEQEKLEVLLALTDELSGGLRSAASAIGELEGKILGVASAFLSVEGASKLFSASLAKADEIQDISRALATFTGSTQRATEAMAFFAKEQEHTRSTADELAKMYTEILPLGISRGWSQLKLQDITVQLDQLAAKAMQAPDALIAGFNRLLSGGAAGAGRNPLLRVLGLDAASVKEIVDSGQNLGEVLAQKLKEKAGDVADSWHSAGEKIKDALLEALGRGVIESFGQGTAAMDNFKKSFTDPEFIKALEDIGNLIGKIATLATGLPKAFAGFLEFGKMLTLNRERYERSLNPGGMQGNDLLTSQALYRADMTALAALTVGASGPLSVKSGVGDAGGAAGGAKTLNDLQAVQQALQKVQEGWRLLRDTTGDVVTATGYYAEQIVKASDNAEVWGVKVSDAWKGITDQARAQITDVGKLDAEYARLLDRIQKALGTTGKIPFASFGGLTGEEFLKEQSAEAMRSAKAIVEEQKAAAAEMAKIFTEHLTRPLEAIFGDVFATGGANFGKIAQQYLAKAGDDLGKKLTDALTGELFKLLGSKVPAPTYYGPGYGYGAPGQTPGQAGFQGYPTQGGYYQGQDPTSAGIAQGLTSGIIGAVGFAQNLQQGATVLSGALAGASVGSVVATGIAGASGLIAGVAASLVGGLIGAFVGAIIVALTVESPKLETWAIPQVKNGVANLVSVMGLSPQDQKDWLQKIQASWDSFRNGFVNIFLKLPQGVLEDVMPMLTAMVNSLTTGASDPRFPGFGLKTGTGGFPPPTKDIIDASNQATIWQKFMTQWVEGTLPRAMQTFFKPLFERTFEDMGVTLDKFQEIWKTAQAMDPKAALQYLGSYLDVLGTLQELVKKIGQPVAGLSADLRAEGAKDAASMLADADKKIFLLAQGLSLLTGQAQLDAVKQLNGLIQSRYDMEKAAVQQLLDMAKAAKDQLTGNLLTLQLAGKTPQQQYAILGQTLSGLEGRLGHESNAAAAQADYQRIVAIIMQMAAMFPKDSGIQGWAAKELTNAEQVFETMLTRFGNAIDTQNQTFTSQIQPLLDSLTTTTSALQSNTARASASLDSLNTAAATAAGAIYGMADAANVFTTMLGNAGYVAAVRQSRNA